MSIQATLKSHERELLSLPGVTGVGIGHMSGREVILVFAKSEPEGPPSDLPQGIPDSLDGFEVVVQPELRIGGSEGA